MQQETILELEKEGKIFVFRPSTFVDIKRVERNVEKVQQMYDLGVKDCEEKLEELKEYFGDRFKGLSIKWSEEEIKSEETSEAVKIKENSEVENKTISGKIQEESRNEN